MKLLESSREKLTSLYTIQTELRTTHDWDRKYGKIKCYCFLPWSLVTTTTIFCLKILNMLFQYNEIQIGNKKETLCLSKPKKAMFSCLCNVFFPDLANLSGRSCLRFYFYCDCDSLCALGNSACCRYLQFGRLLTAKFKGNRWWISVTHPRGFIFLSVVLTASIRVYSAWETFGVEKRDILVDRVESAKDAQEDAQEQFSSALEELSALIAFDGGELEKVYKGLKSEYESSVSSAERVSARIDKVQDVAEALFDEWQTELSLYKSENLRRDSQRKLKETQRQYQAIGVQCVHQSKCNPFLMRCKITYWP